MILFLAFSVVTDRKQSGGRVRRVTRKVALQNMDWFFLKLTGLVLPVSHLTTLAAVALINSQQFDPWFRLHAQVFSTRYRTLNCSQWLFHLPLLKVKVFFLFQIAAYHKSSSDLCDSDLRLNFKI